MPEFTTVEVLPLPAGPITSTTGRAATRERPASALPASRCCAAASASPTSSASFSAGSGARRARAARYIPASTAAASPSSASPMRRIHRSRPLRPGRRPAHAASAAKARRTPVAASQGLLRFIGAAARLGERKGMRTDAGQRARARISPTQEPSDRR